ncbi:MAG: glycosyltransferase family 39 protein [Victivallaceae bacterium]|nr:glycosyltransferase family 39 protein [Victivallaceae bacterium]
MTEPIEQFREYVNSMSSRTFFWLLVLFAAILFFVGLNSRQLYGSDEPRVAGIAAETAIYGNWTEPALNSKPFLEKPPLYLWADSLSLKLFGHSAFAAKLPSAISALLGVLALFMLARNMGASGLTAFISGLVLATSAQYWNGGRKCMIDIMLAAFIIFAFWTFYQLSQSEKFKYKLWWLLALTLSLGGALFSKGLVGLAIPAVAVGAWLFFRDLSNRKLAPADWIWFAAAALLCFIPVGIWLWMLYEQSGYDAFYTVVWTNNFGRFSGGHAEHIEPFYYYLLKLPGQLQPWTVLLPFAFVYSCLKFWKHERVSANKTAYPFLYMLCWLAIPYLLLTISAGKRQVYVLPLYAAEALMIGFMLGDFFENKFSLPWKLEQAKIIKYATVLLSITALVFPVVILGINIYYNDIRLVTLILAAVGIAIGLFTINSLYRKNLSRILLGFVLALTIVFITFDMTIRAEIASKRSYENLFKYCTDFEKEPGKQVVLYSPKERLSGAAVFYLKRRVEANRSVDWLQEKLADQTNKTIVITHQKRLNKLENVTDYNVLKSFKIKKSVILVIVGDKRTKLTSSERRTSNK